MKGDIEANSSCACRPPSLLRRSMKKIGAGFMILCTLLACATILDSGGLTMSEDSCPASGARAHGGKMWKLAREFRRRLDRVGRMLKRVHVQDQLFNDGLSESEFAGQLIHDESVAAIYDLHAKDNLGALTVTVISGAHLHDSDPYWDKTDAFVQCHLQGETIDTKDEGTTFATPHIENDLNPVWNFVHEYAEYTGGALFCQVFDKDNIWVLARPDQPIGTVTFSQEVLTKGWDTFEDMVMTPPEPKPDNWPEDHAPTIRFQVHLEKPAPPPTKDPFWWACDQRVRKDWKDLTGPEKQLYLDAVNAAKMTPREGSSHAGPGGNIYDTFVMIHEQTLNKEYAHQTAGFLAWHRKFLIEYESALRSVGDAYKCVTLPYWDWTSETYGCKEVWSEESGLDSPGCDTYHAASQLLADFGGPGDPSKTTNTHGSSGSGPVGCVTTGPFAGWVDHHGKCLSRGVNWKIGDQKPFSGRVEMLKILTHANYGNQWDKEGFRVVLEGLPHGATHNYLGGHMRSFISPGDPIFFSHHGYIDKLWAVWQDCHDYDAPEVKLALLQDPDHEDNHKYYEHTLGYPDDGAGHVMPFFMKPDFDIGGTDQCPSTGKECTKEDSDCAACVALQDSWCHTNPWDATCCSLCTEPKCGEACKAVVPPEIDFNTVGPAHLKDWVTGKEGEGEATPAHVYSTKEMKDGTNGENRKYTYAHDEIEKALMEEVPEALGECTKLDPSTSLLSLEVRKEVQKFHHTNTRRGHMARSYAGMIAKSFKKAKCDLDEENEKTEEVSKHDKSSSLVEETSKKQLFNRAMKIAQAAECAQMASKSGDYPSEYRCETDSKRCLLAWLGPTCFKEVSSKPDLARAVFCDPCCPGNECLEERECKSIM